MPQNGSMRWTTIYIIKRAWGGGWSVVGGWFSGRRHQGVNILIFSYQVCEGLMLCCSTVLDPKQLLAKTVHLPCTQVAHETRDDAIQ